MKVEGNKKFIISSPKCPWDFGLVATLDYGSERGANSKFCIIDSFFVFFWREYHLMVSVFGDNSYHQTKTPIGFWCRRRLNPRSLIQPSEILPIELIGTHLYYWLKLFNNCSN